jgi:hypothetical protein
VTSPKIEASAGDLSIGEAKGDGPTAKAKTKAKTTKTTRAVRATIAAVIVSCFFRERFDPENPLELGSRLVRFQTRVIGQYGRVRLTV